MSYDVGVTRTRSVVAFNKLCNLYNEAVAAFQSGNMAACREAGLAAIPFGLEAIRDGYSPHEVGQYIRQVELMPETCNSFCRTFRFRAQRVPNRLSLLLNIQSPAKQARLWKACGLVEFATYCLSASITGDNIVMYTRHTCDPSRLPLLSVPADTPGGAALILYLRLVLSENYAEQDTQTPLPPACSCPPIPAEEAEAMWRVMEHAVKTTQARRYKTLDFHLYHFNQLPRATVVTNQPNDIKSSAPRLA